MMKSGSGKIIIAVVVGIIAVVAIAMVTMFNGLVKEDEQIKGEWAQVENQLQRRFDLIPNLVETTKAYAKHEEELFTKLAEARAAYGNAGTLEEQATANDELTAAVSRLLVIAEDYPKLKASERYHALMDELAGTENRIAVARMDYNEKVRDFNSAIRTFPKNIFANMLGFEAYDYFEPTPGAENAPVVNFDEE